MFYKATSTINNDLKVEIYLFEDVKSIMHIDRIGKFKFPFTATTSNKDLILNTQISCSTELTLV